MSQWSHINGSIRVDGLGGLIPKPLFGDLFKTVDYDDPEEKWDECNVPCGSEGSVQINIWQNPNPSCMAQYTINVFGDLRNYSDVQEVANWFEKIVKKSGLLIRSAVLTCAVEFNALHTFVYVNNDEPIKVYTIYTKEI